MTCKPEMDLVECSQGHVFPLPAVAVCPTCRDRYLSRLTSEEGLLREENRKLKEELADEVARTKRAEAALRETVAFIEDATRADVLCREEVRGAPWFQSARATLAMVPA